MKLRALLLIATLGILGGCFRDHRDCREHENWDGHVCHAEPGYEHYWDHPDHRDWHPADDHHDDHHDDDHHDDHH